MASTETRLVEHIVPARGAAKKASASFTEQLTDSPGRSDVDAPSPSNLFHEPSPRTKSVKYRYSAAGKHLSSPFKGSSSSPERKPNRPKKSKLATLTPAPPSHATKGKALAATVPSRKRRASATSLRKEDLLNSIFISSPSPLSSAPTSPTASANDRLSSPSFAVKDLVPDPPRRVPVSKTLSLHSFGTTTSKLSVSSQPLSSKRKQKRKGKAIAHTVSHVWDIGNSVWVLVNHSGVLVDSAQPQGDFVLSEPLMWWPAQVVQKQPLRVSMFGDFPSSSSTDRGLCTVFAPSSSNVQSIHDDSGTKRFSRATFCLTSLSTDDEVGPPTKRPRLDDVASTEARWEAAVQCMDKASTLEKDGLPALLSSYATAGGSFYDSLDDSDHGMSDFKRSPHKPTSSGSKRSKHTESTRGLKSQRSRANLKGNVGGSTPRHSSPCPPDPTLQIPGELVLAMAPKTGGFYWPAKILQHVPDRKEKYKVKFLDDEEHVITRDKFWTSEEEGFVRCTLGEWDSAIKTTDDLGSGDEGDEYGADDTSAQIPDDSALPPPPPAGDFEDLSVRMQLVYVKPILRAILNKEYAPARDRHEAFMRGGSARAALLKSAGVRGGMDARFVKAVQRATCEWVLGSSGVRPKRLDVGDSETRNSEVEEGPTVKVASPKVPPADCDSMQNDEMEGVEATVVPEDVHTDKSDGAANEDLPLATPDKHAETAQIADTVVDRLQQDPVPLPPPANGVAPSPTIKQAALAHKSQLDLLAEVSQAVATEPSLLPSHPDIPRLRIHLLDIPCKDASPQPSPLTPVSDEDQSLPQQGSLPMVCEEFVALSGVEKLDYCLNILLPESIQQLLLWRSGERTSPALLSPEEEQRLHDVGARKAAETDWVDDLMRLRAAQARLWGVDLNKKPEEKKAEVVPGGTRSRPRRATVSRP